jgi:hypothetical protein
MKPTEDLTRDEINLVRRAAEIMFPYFRGMIEEIEEDHLHDHRDELPQMKKALAEVRALRELFY